MASPGQKVVLITGCSSGTESWRSLLLPSSSPAQTPLLPLPSLSLGSLMNNLINFDIPQDFHLPDDQFASLKLHKLRQVAVESGVEHFTSPSYNTRRSVRCSVILSDPVSPLSLPLSLTPTIANSPQPTEAKQAATQSVDVQNVSMEHKLKGKLVSQSLSEESCNREIPAELQCQTNTISTESAADRLDQYTEKDNVDLNTHSESSVSARNTHRSTDRSVKPQPHLSSADEVNDSDELKIKSPVISSEEQTDCRGVVHPSEDQRSINHQAQDKAVIKTLSFDCSPQKSPEELLNRSTAVRSCDDSEVVHESPVQHVNVKSPAKDSKPASHLARRSNPGSMRDVPESRVCQPPNCLQHPASGLRWAGGPDNRGDSGGTHDEMQTHTEAAGKWAVCLWSQTSASDWNLRHTWAFNEPVINVFPVPDAAGLICVTLGQLEIREVRMLSCSSLLQVMLCEGVVQAAVGVSKSRVVTSAHSASGSTLQVFTLSDSGSTPQPLVSPGVCVGALALVDGLSDALIGTDEDRCLFIWNLKTGQLLRRIILGDSLSHTACLRGYSYCGVLFVLLQHQSLTPLEGEDREATAKDQMFLEEEVERKKNVLFILLAINPLSGKSALATQLYPPKAWSGRLCEADVNSCSVVGLSQSGCVCVWELGHRVAPRMVWAPESEGWQLARWGGGGTLVTGHHNGDVTLHCSSTSQTSLCRLFKDS
ncbi:Partner and localizer of BRCA2 [Collichthys lucidus]|uniref:Partner and localizer of BRCA2 n=1 Tax=Collichthys lucidus TaxID=240159 RepID=A0A4V6AND3_COLLU|nr:Partner and localizer of BRCA2 [Collichthys lucidus]